MGKLNHYELFVTYIDPKTDMAKIKDHIYRNLGVKVIVRCVSKKDADWLSIGLFCTSVRADLDFKKPGIWPRNTEVYRWRPKPSGYKSGNTYTQGQGVSSAVSPFTGGVGLIHTDVGSRNNSGYSYPNRDQQLLHDQFQ